MTRLRLQFGTGAIVGLPLALSWLTAIETEGSLVVVLYAGPVYAQIEWRKS